MARPRKATLTPEAPAPVAETPAIEGDAPVRRRRRRRTTPPPAPDYAQETVLLVEAALKSRGSKGATEDLLGKVVGWARGVRAEGDELKTINSRPRRTKNQPSTDRTASHDLNRALLDGILTGGITIDVQDDGKLLFLSAGAIPTSDGGLPFLSTASEPEEVDATGA